MRETTKTAHLEENIASASLELPQPTYETLAAVQPAYRSLPE
jgi:aryl-alcohol dehydrogenase-like predicted oxidoreductase